MTLFSLSYEIYSPISPNRGAAGSSVKFHLPSLPVRAILGVMEFLDVEHNASLVAVALIVALVAGFTGLSLTKDLSSKTLYQRKVAVT